MQNEDAGPSQPSSSQHSNGLQGIDDFDFETLIELLGTTAKEKVSDDFSLHDVERSQVDISHLTFEPDATIPARRETGVLQPPQTVQRNGDVRYDRAQRVDQNPRANGTPTSIGSTVSSRCKSRARSGEARSVRAHDTLLHSQQA